MTEPVLRFEDLSVVYRSAGAAGARGVHALRGITLEVARGSRVGLVGESGSGKTTLGLTVLRLLPDSASCTGSLLLWVRATCCCSPVSIPLLTGSALRHLRGRHASMVFQDPFNALNPVVRIGRQMVSAIRCHRPLRGADAYAFAAHLLRRVHLDDPDVVLRKYPHQLSGGQLQRVCIAIALAHDPDVIVADEPTTALDAHVRDGILSLLDEAAAAGGSVLLITHDMGVVEAHTDSTCILYAGEIVETGPTAAVTGDPLHPYTRLLLAARPTARRRGVPLAVIPGTLPDLSDTAAFTRCIFLPRCPERLPVCERAGPPQETARDGRTVRCYRYGGGGD